MDNRNEIIRLPKVRNLEGDLNKKCYIEFYVRSPYSDKMERFRKFEGINKFKTFKERSEAGEKMKQYWLDKLRSGWIPIKRKDLTIYENDGFSFEHRYIFKNNLMG
ncbi:MAG: hypothetical protein HN778_20600 [Prolixibacteraceae bacterium]|jgi:hypothetical protein|nr:hypothetical protein [Prolixibacteraceae bacterium]MBT6007544.1 hypothetical protein [Prolixibacteraceae bacterium]MBT6998713.1 hypothetical protein [Prolixibacteraceae bacterium]MBT7397238.1 hypothetical protein [Prolixibacteraceae bacterium]